MIKSKLRNYLTDYSRKEKFSLIKKLWDTGPSEVLDIACGKGEFLEKLIYEDHKDKHMMSRVIALDFRKSHLLDVKKKYNVEKLVAADACALPFKNRSINLIVSNAFLEHLPIHRRETFSREVERVGKSYWIALPNKYSFLEIHYHLPFIGWLKPVLRDKIIRILRRKLHYDPINLMTRNELENLFPDHSKSFKLNIFGLVSHLIVIKVRKRDSF